MPCLPLVDRGKIVGMVCGFHPVYRYGGWLFEVHSYHGPWPLNKRTHEPRVTVPKAFWDMWDEFDALFPDVQAKYLVVDP